MFVSDVSDFWFVGKVNPAFFIANEEVLLSDYNNLNWNEKEIESNSIFGATLAFNFCLNFAVRTAKTSGRTRCVMLPSRSALGMELWEKDAQKVAVLALKLKNKSFERQSLTLQENTT